MTSTVPVMATEAPGNYITGALWNAQVAALGNFLMNPPRFRGYQATTQSCADNTWTSLNIDTEEFDTEGGHSNVTNTTRYTCQVAGTYLIVGASAFAGNATGNRAVRLTVNGNAIHGSFVKNAAPTATHSAGCVTTAYAALAVGDYVEVQGLQSSGAALSTSSATDVGSALSVQWIAA